MMKPSIALLATLLLLPLAACDRNAAPAAQVDKPAANPVFLADNAIWRDERKQALLQRNKNGTID